jgi:hypothetical protein
MDYRTLKINKICARGVKDITFFSKLMVYAVVSISGDPFNPHQTHQRGPCRLKKPHMELLPQIQCNGVSRYPRSSFSQNPTSRTTFQPRYDNRHRPYPSQGVSDNPGYHLSCQVYNKKSKKSSGTLNFSYEFGGRVEAPPPPKPKLGPFHSFEDAYMYCVKDIGMPYGPYAVRYGA